MGTHLVSVGGPAAGGIVAEFWRGSEPSVTQLASFIVVT